MTKYSFEFSIVLLFLTVYSADVVAAEDVSNDVVTFFVIVDSDSF